MPVNNHLQGAARACRSAPPRLEQSVRPEAGCHAAGRAEVASAGSRRRGGKTDRLRNRPAVTSLSRSRLVAATKRTSTCSVREVPQPGKLTRLQHPQQMRLQVKREITDLIEKKSAAMGRSDKTDAIAVRAGECALHEAEEFRANQALPE